MRIPSLRRRVIRGQEIGYVTLRDRVSGKVRDVWLGPYAVCGERYARALAEWEARGRRIVYDASRKAQLGGITVTQVCAEYWDWLEANYSRSQQYVMRQIVRLLVGHYGSVPAATFGPNALRALREAMVRKGWTRNSCNRGAHRAVSVFRWAAGRELVDAAVWQALKSIEPLRRGAAEDPAPIGPAPTLDVEKSLRFCSMQVAAMVRLQLLTGMRPGEVVAMRLCEVETTGSVWFYRPADHKTAHRGRGRAVALGPAAQAIVRRFMRRSTTAFLFSPAEAMRRAAAIRRCAAMKTGAGRGTGRARERYDVSSYRRAIAYACARAGVEAWNPNQLRHSSATEVRRVFGLEAAQAWLGHSSAKLTDAVYAERNQQTLVMVAEKF